MTIRGLSNSTEMDNTRLGRAGQGRYGRAYVRPCHEASALNFNQGTHLVAYEKSEWASGMMQRGNAAPGNASGRYGSDRDFPSVLRGKEFEHADAVLQV